MKSLLFTGLVAAATISTNVSAGLEVGDTITAMRLGTSPSHAIRFNYDASRSWDQAATGADYFGIAGVSNFSTDSGGSIMTFCIEMNEGFVDDPIVYDVVDIADVPEEAPPGPMSESAQTLIKDLYARWYGTLMTVFDTPGNWGTRQDYAAAFQLAVWEITHENLSDDAATAVTELSIDTGAMVITDSYSDEVMNITNNIFLSLGTGGFFNYNKLLGLTNPNNQDMLVVVPTPAIAGLAALGLAGMRRRRR